MDLGTTIIGLFLVLLFIAPFVIMSRKSRNKEKKHLQSLSEFAEKVNCKISHFDTWHNTVIGFDEKNKVIFFSINVNEIGSVQQIPLPEIQSCRMVNISRTVKSEKESFVITDKLALAFTYIDKNKSETSLEFYNSETGKLGLNGELQLAEKWCKIAKDGKVNFA